MSRSKRGRLWTPGPPGPPGSPGPPRRAVAPLQRAWRTPLAPSRRGLLQGMGAAFAGLPFAPLLVGRRARAAPATASRVIFFYFPDGVPAWSQSGEASLWHCSGSEHDFSMPACLDPLAEWRDRCIFFNGLSMGGTDEGSHPGGARKLLTAADGGNGPSIDQHLSGTIGADSPWRHLYVGVQANANGASDDDHIVYPYAGTSITPEDDPRAAFEALFGSWSGSSGGGSGGSDGSDTGEPDPETLRRQKALGVVMDDLLDLRRRLDGIEKDKLDYHLSSLESLEGRLSGGTGGGATGLGDCDEPAVNTADISDSTLYEARTFPAILQAQLETVVLAMECGLTRVATVQCSMHTSELVMSQFEGTDMYDPGFDMRSHQASHYGSTHDWDSREFTAFFQQRQWFLSQFAALLELLESRPEGDGTMLDHSIVVLVSEVCDGNIHDHGNMPFVVAGGAGGAWSTGRLLETGGAPHGNLWVSIANRLGDDQAWFGDRSSGALWGL